ncbi:MAG: type 1 glutamine amidotransferase [Kiritimatiellia bacterium]
MQAQIFQHVPFEGPGRIGNWLTQNGYESFTTHFYLGESPPKITEVDLLIVMGGPMSVNDEDSYPWLKREKAFIREAVNAGIPVLGICLGAQLIASALGARVYPNPVKEIGWFPVFGKPVDSPFRLPEELTALHWHGETFDLPPGARLLASTPECRNQAFLLEGKKVLGLQFHLETTPESMDSLIENCRDELVSAPHIMAEAQIREQAGSFLPDANRWMETLLRELTADG